MRVIVLYQNKGVHTGKFTKNGSIVLTGGMFSGINSRRMVYEKMADKETKQKMKNIDLGLVELLYKMEKINTPTYKAIMKKAKGGR